MERFPKRPNVFDFYFYKKNIKPHIMKRITDKKTLFLDSSSTEPGLNNKREKIFRNRQNSVRINKSMFIVPWQIQNDQKTASF